MSAKRTAMSSVDTSWLRMESPESPMMIGAVLVFDEPINIGAFRNLLEKRFLRFERFRQRVVYQNDRFYWEKDPWFDLDNHLHITALPGEADQAALQQLTSDLNSTPLDFAHPLWQIHYVDNYQGGCALIVRIHHCIADGISLVRVLLSLTDEQERSEAQHRISKHRKRIRRRPPEWRQTLFRARRNLRLARWQLRQTWRTMREDPGYVVRLAREGAFVGRDLLKVAIRPPDPPTALKGPQCGRKQVAWSEPLNLGEVKATAKALNGTVNDVLLAAATGAMHTHLQQSGTPLPETDIHVAVPFNLRPLDQPITRLGNQFGLVLVPLPVQTLCPRERFETVQRYMDEIKRSYQAQVSYGLLDILGRGPDLIERRALELLSRRASAVLTNVPGPDKPLHLCGCRLRTPMFWVPQTGDVGIGLSIFSYAGQVQFGVISDRQLIASPERMATAFADAFHQLRDLALENKVPLESALGRPYTGQYGDDPDSTPVTKPEVHAETAASLDKSKLR